MELFDYLMAKNGQNTGGDLFSYLLGKKASGGSGTYTTFSGTSLNISDTIKAKIKNFMLNSTELTQDGTPTPDNPVDVNVITGDNNIKITDGTEEQNYPITLSSDNLFDFDKVNITRLGSGGNVSVYNNEIVFTATGQEVFGITIDLAGLNLKDNTTYTVSNLMDNTDVSVNPLGWRYYNGSSYTPLNNYQTEFTFTTSNSGINVGAPTNYNGMLTLSNIQLEEGNTPTIYVPSYSIEYCKIGDYADQIFKNTIDSEFYDSTLQLNEWYLKKKVSKIDSYNGETITTPYISTTGGLDTGATVYYGLTTPTYIHISQADYPVLRSQLENLYNNAKSYKGQTNITQTNENLPFNISVDVKVEE